MGNIGGSELLIILVLALLLLGPKRLPEVGEALGRSLRRFRQASRDLRDELDVSRDPELRRDLGDIRHELDVRRDLDDIRSDLDVREELGAARETIVRAETRAVHRDPIAAPGSAAPVDAKPAAEEHAAPGEEPEPHGPESRELPRTN